MTLWHDMFPLSSSPSKILCLNKCLLIPAIHLSRLWFSLILINMHKNMAAAFRNNHITPRPNNVNPVTPENSSPNKTTKAVNIQTTRILL